MSPFFRRADFLLRHPEELVRTLGDALKKTYAKRAVLRRVFSDFILLFRFVRAWVRGDYREMPRKSVYWALFAIIYFLSPIDLIPDHIPVFGLLDDYAVLGLAIAYYMRRFPKLFERRVNAL